MKKEDILSTLFVGIDVSLKTNVVCALDFSSNKLLAFSAENNHSGAVLIAERVSDCLKAGSFIKVIIALESTSVYSTHIACFLSTAAQLLPYKAEVYCLNPKTIAAYKKSFIGIGKTDPVDAFVIADFARVGRIDSKPWRGSQFLALQRLTRHRLHLAESIAREKSYMLTNIFLKFSELAADKDNNPFSNTFGATSEAVLKDFLSTDDIINLSLEDLVAFIDSKGRSHFTDPEKTAKLLKQAATNSYRLDKCLYEPLTISIASSFNCISTFEKELKNIDKAIANAIKGLNPNEYTCLTSVPGIGHVYAAGILAEIGTIVNFNSEAALAKYSGLYWSRPQSGDFEADNTHMSKEGNSYLRYYLIQAANSVKNHAPEFAAFYQKKFIEATSHHHSRAIALSARKLIRLIFGLLGKNQLYSPAAVRGTI